MPAPAASKVRVWTTRTSGPHAPPPPRSSRAARAHRGLTGPRASTNVDDADEGRVAPRDCHNPELGSLPSKDHKPPSKTDLKRSSPPPGSVREALDLEHATGLRLADAGVPCLRALPAGELGGEGPEHVACQGRVEGDHPRDVARQSQDELSVRSFRQNAVHQVRRLLIHAPARARRTDAALAGERDHARPAAGCAREPNKPKLGSPHGMIARSCRSTNNGRDHSGASAWAASRTLPGDPARARRGRLRRARAGCKRARPEVSAGVHRRRRPRRSERARPLAWRSRVARAVPAFSPPRVRLRGWSPCVKCRSDRCCRIPHERMRWPRRTALR